MSYRISHAIVLLTAAIGGACLAADGSTSFSDAERKALLDAITPELSRSATNAFVNQAYDIGFKILLFIVSCLAAIGAARVAALGKDEVPPTWLKTSNLALTALVPLITTLAFTQFDFFKRQIIWEKRLYALTGCQMSLQYTQPDRVAFISSLDTILKWGDATAVNELNISCINRPPQKPSESTAEPKSQGAAPGKETAGKSASDSPSSRSQASSGAASQVASPPSVASQVSR